MRKFTFLIAVWFAFTNLVSAAPQTYPDRQIKFVVPYPPGGATDTVARIVAGKLSESWKHSIVIENHFGGGGIVGNDIVAKAAPDGYTVLFAITELIQAPALNIKVPYDVFKDFIPVSQCVVVPNLFVVPASAPANSLDEFVTTSKRNSGEFSYGSYGAGTSSHIYGELLKRTAGIDLVHVPYKGAAPLLNDVLAGHVDAAILDITTGLSQIQAGAIKAFAITGHARSKLLPNVPTFIELGYRGFEPLGWVGVFVPAGTADVNVNKMSDEIGRIVRLPDVAARFYQLGAEPVGNTSAQFIAILKADYRQWGKVIAEANIKIE
jgi:tripartite-type tricarboxylate transporter receptor subunit TctC